MKGGLNKKILRNKETKNVNDERKKKRKKERKKEVRKKERNGTNQKKGHTERKDKGN
jgi:hypothetical protein